MTFSWKTFGFKKINKKIILLIILCVLLLYFHTRGLYYSDDGYILTAAQRVADGQIPYKDFHFVYTPLSIYLDALAFKLFGTSILAARIMALLLSLTTVFILFKTVQMLTAKTYLQYCVILLYLAWGPTHANFIFPTQVALTMGLLTCLLLLKSMQKKKNKFLFWAGITTVLTILSKQNFGVALLPIIIVFFFFLPKVSMRQITQFVIGFLSSALIFILLFFFSGALAGFIHDFYQFSIQYIVKQGAFATSFFYEFSLYGILKSLFYLSPLIISLLAIKICFQKNKKLLFLPIFTLIFYFTGIRPTTDYIHLTPLLAISGLPFLLFLKDAKKSLFKNIVNLTLIFLILLGFYTGLWKNYYRWHQPLIDNKTFEFHHRINIFVPNHLLADISREIESHTNKDDYIFITLYSPMFYFTADRKNPTNFDLFEEFPYYEKYKKEILKDIETKKTKVIVTYDGDENGFLSEYIKKRYHKVAHIESVYIWKLSN